MPYKSRQSRNAYWRGYKAGARRIVIAWLGSICEECEETDMNKLEIAHIEPMRKRGRDYTTWLDKDNVKLLCTSCNQGEENGNRAIYGKR